MSQDTSRWVVKAIAFGQVVESHEVIGRAKAEMQEEGLRSKMNSRYLPDDPWTVVREEAKW